MCATLAGVIAVPLGYSLIIFVVRAGDLNICSPSVSR